MTAIQLLLHISKRLIIAALFALVPLTGCGPGLPPSKPLAVLTPAEHAGREVYVARCGGCHYPNSSAPLHGPGLYAVLRNQYLPSGAPANDDTVTHAVVRGRGMMPAFGNTLDEQQMQDLLAYLHTL
jgi:mono/diheme cytochrome c family protein